MVVQIKVTQENRRLFNKAKGKVLNKNPYLEKTSNNAILEVILKKFVKGE